MASTIDVRTGPELAATPQGAVCARDTYRIGQAQSRLVWLAELEPVCVLLLARQTPAALELADGLRAAAAARVRDAHKVPASFRFYPNRAQAGLLSGVLEEARWQLWHQRRAA